MMDVRSRPRSPGQVSLFELARLSTQATVSDEAIVQTLAEQLLDQADAEPPVDVHILASLRGITDIESVEQPWAGVLIPGQDGFRVRVRESDGWPRQRFTIGHEATHTFLPGFLEAEQFRCDPHDGHDHIEALCDVGASELLMPRRQFSIELGISGLDLDSVEALADRYETSLEATGIRAVDLWPEPAMLIVFRVQTKPSERSQTGAEPKLRVAWTHSSGHWPFILRHKSVDQRSPFALALDGEAVEGTYSLGSLATEDVHAQLQARPYGTGRVLALLRPARSRVAA